MTVVLAIIGVQASLAVLLFGTLLLDRPADIGDAGDHSLLRFLRRRTK